MLQIQPKPELGVAISHDYRAPAYDELAGGDLIALNRHDDGTTTLLVADLSAKGEEGTALASWLATVFHLTSAVIWRPSRILKHLNTMLGEAFYDQTEGLFASAFIGRMCPEQSYMVYSSAGAEPPMLFNASRKHHDLKAGGLVLGIEKRAYYDDYVVSIAPNDVLIAFTDGIPESKRSFFRERLGRRGVVKAVEATLRKFASANSEEIFRTIDSLNNGVYSDDATLLVASINVRY